MAADGQLDALRRNLAAAGSVAVAFSGGVDSTFLLAVAHDVLGDRAVAVTARSATFPARELDDARQFCRARAIRHEILDFDALAVDGFAANPPDRCYRCKKALLTRMIAFAHANGLAQVVEGSNTDDDGDYRPGRRAIRELGVASPLRDAGLAKDDVRRLSRARGLPTWRKPSFACLASRFPYGETITAAGLTRVADAEQYLLTHVPGLAQVRVRSHGDVARIEVPPADFDAVAARRAEIAAALRRAGFAAVALDLTGYRTGSLNEALPPDVRAAAEGKEGAE